MSTAYDCLLSTAILHISNRDRSSVEEPIRNAETRLEAHRVEATRAVVDMRQVDLS